VEEPSGRARQAGRVGKRRSRLGSKFELEVQVQVQVQASRRASSGGEQSGKERERERERSEMGEKCHCGQTSGRA